MTYFRAERQGEGQSDLPSTIFSKLLQLKIFNMARCHILSSMSGAPSRSVEHLDIATASQPVTQTSSSTEQSLSQRVQTCATPGTQRMTMSAQKTQFFQIVKLLQYLTLPFPSVNKRIHRLLVYMRYCDQEKQQLAYRPRSPEHSLIFGGKNKAPLGSLGNLPFARLSGLWSSWQNPLIHKDIKL